MCDTTHSGPWAHDRLLRHGSTETANVHIFLDGLIFKFVTKFRLEQLLELFTKSSNFHRADFQEKETETDGFLLLT
jgi:hypothetical protein